MSGVCNEAYSPDHHKYKKRILQSVRNDAKTPELPPQQKNGILCVLVAEVAAFSPPAVDFLATSAENRPSTNSMCRGGNMKTKQGREMGGRGAYAPPH